MKIKDIINENGFWSGLKGAVKGYQQSKNARQVSRFSNPMTLAKLKQSGLLTPNKLNKITHDLEQHAKNLQIQTAIIQALSDFKKWKNSNPEFKDFENWFQKKFKRSSDHTNHEDFFNNIDDYEDDVAFGDWPNHN